MNYVIIGNVLNAITIFVLLIFTKIVELDKLGLLGLWVIFGILVIAFLFGLSTDWLLKKKLNNT